MGHASGCWEHLDRAGVFDSSQAGEALDEIVATLNRAWDEKERINKALVREIARLSSQRPTKVRWRVFRLGRWALFIGWERLQGADAQAPRPSAGSKAESPAAS